MIARISPSFPQVAAAIFPVPGCTVRGYACAHGTRYNLTIITHGQGLPAQYLATGANCYEALAKAVQLFNESAHAYPAARPLAAAGSYAPPAQARPFPDDDEPASFYDDEANRLYLEEARHAHEQASGAADDEPQRCPVCSSRWCQNRECEREDWSAVDEGQARQERGY